MIKLEYLEWDSKLLGVNSYRLQIVRKSVALESIQLLELQHTLIHVISDPNVQFIYCRINACDIRLIQQLESIGFYMVDNLITFRKNLLKDSKDASLRTRVRRATNQDLPFAKELHSNFTMGRFHNDPRIPEPIPAIIYEQWIHNSITGNRADQVFVHENEEGKITGFISCILSEDSKGNPCGVIDLITVSPEFQGCGIGMKLLEKAVEYFVSKQVSYVKVGTQADNRAAILLYQKLDFLVDSIDVSLHYWNDKK